MPYGPSGYLQSWRRRLQGGTAGISTGGYGQAPAATPKPPGSDSAPAGWPPGYKPKWYYEMRGVPRQNWPTAAAQQRTAPTVAGTTQQRTAPTAPPIAPQQAVFTQQALPGTSVSQAGWTFNWNTPTGMTPEERKRVFGY